MRTTMSKMSKINKWADRYFVLHGPVLYYYLKNTDTVITTRNIDIKHKPNEFLSTAHDIIYLKNSVVLPVGTQRNN